MPRIDVPEGMRPIDRVDELSPALRKVMREFRRATFDDCSLPFAEVELIRLRCAQLNGCAACFNYRIARDDPERGARANGRLTPEWYLAVIGEGDLDLLTEREQVIREYCERFYFDHFAMDNDEDFWTRMKANFGDEELVEIGILVLSFGSSARFNHVFGVDAMHCEAPATA